MFLLPPQKTFGARGILFSAVSVCEWVCEWVSLWVCVAKILRTLYLRKQWREFHTILVTYVLAL